MPVNTPEILSNGYEDAPAPVSETGSLFGSRVVELNGDEYDVVPDYNALLMEQKVAAWQNANYEGPQPIYEREFAEQEGLVRLEEYREAKGIQYAQTRQDMLELLSGVKTA